LALNFIHVIKLQAKCTTLNLQMPNMHKLPTTLRTPKFLTNNAAICPTVFKAETCCSINQQIKNMAQKVGVKFCI